MRGIDRRSGRVFDGMTIGWPVELPDSGTRFVADQILAGMHANGVRVEPREIPQHPRSPFHVLLAEVDDGNDTHTIAFDLDDWPEVVEPIAEQALLYFKQQ